MRSITKIAFKNYKAFYGEGKQNELYIPYGQNLLIYGENGSGKSSIFEGLKQFFNSSNVLYAESPSRHIRVPKTYTDTEDPENPIEKQTEVAVTIQFTDEHSNSEEKTFGVPQETVKGTRYIAEANSLNSFLSYRELLRTYLIDNLKDRYLFRKSFATLMVENILGRNKNSATQKSYKELWNQMFLPRIRNKEGMLDNFIVGLNHDILRINILLNDILIYFENGLEIEIVNSGADIKYGHSDKACKTLKYPELEIDLKVKLFGEEIEIDEENHLTVLNEARLSSLALSIYLAALILTPQENLEYKILFLDDVFIGLDTSNRVPLLEILNSYYKPKFEETLDAAGNITVNLIQHAGEIEREDVLFFESYQIFITTYDRNWFEISRQYFEHRAQKKWHCIEVFVDNLSNNFNTPFVTYLNSKIEKAEEYLHRHDYRACAIYLRSACEKELSRILTTKHKFISENNQQGNLITRPAGLHEMISGFETFCNEQQISFDPFINLKVYKNHILNALSHNDIHSPIYKKELFDTVKAIKNLSNIVLKEVPNKIQDLTFVIPDVYGNVVSVRIRKRDTIFIYQFDGNQNLSFFCSCDLESVEVNGNVTPYNKNFESLLTLYDDVCINHDIQDKPRLIDILCKRSRRSGEANTLLIDLFNTNLYAV